MSADLTVHVDGEAAVDLDPVKAELVSRANQLASDGGANWSSFDLLFASIVDLWTWEPGPPARIECVHALPTSITLHPPGHAEIKMRVCLIATCKDCELDIPSGYNQ